MLGRVQTDPAVRPRSVPVRRLLRRIGAASLVPIAAASLVGIDPATFGLSTTPIVLHAISFRGPLGLGLTAAGTVGLLTGLIPPRVRPWRRLIAGGLVLACGLANLGVVAGRGWAGPTSTARADLVVVSSNTLGGAASPRQLADLIAAEMTNADAAMVSLPETPAALAQQTADLLAAAGHRFQVFNTTEPGQEFGSTSLLISDQLGPYRQVPAPSVLLGAVLALPVDGHGPTLAAVHPGAPVPGVGYPQWTQYVSRAVGVCRDHPGSIVAGDFNTTVDHRMLRELGPCFDAATRAGRGGEGTWPSNLPAPLAAPIDHVLLNGNGFTVLGTRTERIGGSDHRALIARLRLS